MALVKCVLQSLYGSLASAAAVHLPLQISLRITGFIPLDSHNKRTPMICNMNKTAGEVAAANRVMRRSA